MFILWTEFSNQNTYLHLNNYLDLVCFCLRLTLLKFMYQWRTIVLYIYALILSK